MPARRRPYRSDPRRAAILFSNVTSARTTPGSLSALRAGVVGNSRRLRYGYSLPADSLTLIIGSWSWKAIQTAQSPKSMA